MQVDLVKKEGASAQQQMVRVAEHFNGLHSFEQTFWVSALRDQGMAKLKDFLRDRYNPLFTHLSTMHKITFERTGMCFASPICFADPLHLVFPICWASPVFDMELPA